MGTHNWKTDERGGILFFFAILLIPLIGFMAYSLDFGMTYTQWRHAQFASDAAALNGALVIQNGGSSDAAIRSAASEVGTENGLQAGVDYNVNSDVEIGNWDDSGAGTFTANGAPKNAVRVTAQRNVPTRFARLLGLTDMNPSVESIAYVTPSGTPMCVSPFGIESINFPEELNIGSEPLGHTFTTPLEFTVGKNSPGNWGKIDVPDDNGDPINMSAGPTNFCHAMTQDDAFCNSSPPDWDPCLSPVNLGDDELGEPYDGAPGASDVGDVLDHLIGEDLAMLVNSPFGNGKDVVSVYGYAIGQITGVSGKGANLEITVSIDEIRTDVPTVPIPGGGNERLLVK